MLQVIFTVVAVLSGWGYAAILFEAGCQCETWGEVWEAAKSGRELVIMALVAVIGLQIL